MPYRSIVVYGTSLGVCGDAVAFGTKGDRIARATNVSMYPDRTWHGVSLQVTLGHLSPD
jgi:hypothetical protein